MNRLSLLSILASIVVILYLDFSYKFYESDENIIASDAIHYYGYLPTVLVYKDIYMNFLNEDLGKYKKFFFEGVKLPNGQHYILTPMGVSILQAVFIVPLHYSLIYYDLTADGFSEPYRITLILNSLFYYVLALLLIRNLLLKRLKISDTVVALTLLGIGVATNIVLYVTKEPSMSHVYSFFAITLFVYCLDKLISKPKALIALLTGIVFGLAILIRPANIVIGSLFLFWYVSTLSEVKERFLFYFKKPLITILILLGAVIIWIPQIIYNYLISGSLFFNGYGEQTRFFFNNPQIINVLFSYRKGWFIYTPIMFLAVIGFIPLYKNNKKIFWPVLVVLVTLLYINSSWVYWWFGGSFGQRPLIDIYGLMAFPLAAFANMLWNKKIGFKIAIVFVVLILSFHSVFQIKQYINGAIHFIAMTKEAYWYSFGRLHKGPRLETMFEYPDYDLARKGIYPKPACKKRSKEEWILFMEAGIRRNPEMIKFLEEKAKKNNKTLETVIKEDARWLFKEDRKLFAFMAESR